MNTWVRQFHRWMSVFFTLGTLANFVAIAMDKYANWLGILAGVPLALLWLTGMYLFVLPYTARRRGGSTV